MIRGIVVLAVVIGLTAKLYAISPTLNVTLTGASLGDLSSGSNSHVAMAVLTLDSTGTNGFSLSISSDSTDGKAKGRFVRYLGGVYQTGTAPGNYCDYSIDLVSKGVGTLGSVAPTLPSESVVSPDITLNFTPYSVPTTGYQYDLKVNTSANSKLFNGTFQDVLTITLTDL